VLLDMGVLTAADLPALEMMCLHFAVSRAALEEMIKDGRNEIQDDDGRTYFISEDIAVTTEGMHGIKKHPAASVFRENSQTFRLYLTEFGLTPAARVRVKTQPAEEKSLAEMLFEAVNG